jgi:hypothetical protein
VRAPKPRPADLRPPRQSLYEEAARHAQERLSGDAWDGVVPMTAPAMQDAMVAAFVAGWDAAARAPADQRQRASVETVSVSRSG